MSESLGLHSDGKDARPLTTPGVAWAVSFHSQVQPNMRVCDWHQLCSSRSYGKGYLVSKARFGSRCATHYRKQTSK